MEDAEWLSPCFECSSAVWSPGIDPGLSLDPETNEKVVMLILNPRAVRIKAILATNVYVLSLDLPLPSPTFYQLIITLAFAALFMHGVALLVKKCSVCSAPLNSNFVATYGVATNLT